MTPGHNGKPVTDRIADYIEYRAERFIHRAATTGSAELLTRATTLNAVASDIPEGRRVAVLVVRISI